MTLSSQGTTVTFAGAALGKVVGVGGSFASQPRAINELAYNVDADTGQYLPVYEKTTCDQSLDLDCIATSFSTAVVGTKGALSVTGSGWSVSFGVAICADVKVTARVGDIVRVQYSFKRSYA